MTVDGSLIPYSDYRGQGCHLPGFLFIYLLFYYFSLVDLNSLKKFVSAFPVSSQANALKRSSSVKPFFCCFMIGISFALVSFYAFVILPVFIVMLIMLLVVCCCYGITLFL